MEENDKNNAPSGARNDEARDKSRTSGATKEKTPRRWRPVWTFLYLLLCACAVAYAICGVVRLNRELKLMTEADREAMRIIEEQLGDANEPVDLEDEGVSGEADASVEVLNEAEEEPSDDDVDEALEDAEEEPSEDISDGSDAESSEETLDAVSDAADEEASEGVSNGSVDDDVDNQI